MSALGHSNESHRIQSFCFGEYHAAFFHYSFLIIFLNIKINELFRTFSLFSCIVLTLSIYFNPQCDRHLNTCIKSIELYNLGLQLITQATKYFSSYGPCGSDRSIKF